MQQSTYQSALLSLSLDRGAALPLSAQLTEHLRRLILARRLEPRAKLPSSRSLAEELSVSRATIVAAYDQLASEGYIESRQGAGMYVAAAIPDHALQAEAPDRTPSPSPSSAPRLSQPPPPVPFQTTLPDLSLFPHAEWARLFDRVWRAPAPALLGMPDPLGWAPLREAIAEHLSIWRGVACAAAQVVVTSGAFEAIDILAQAALQTGDRVLVEDPGFRKMRRALQRSGLEPAPVPVDDDGFDIAIGRQLWPDARAAVVTPSRHYPLGATLPLSRRLDLLNWASTTDGLIIEDDYDSEYRYEGRPLPALMGLDDGERTAYVGSFSKVLAPSLRLGFVVAPLRLLNAVEQVMAASGPSAGLTLQPVLARFMADGSFAAHIRRMRRAYAGRQRALIAAIQALPPGLLLARPAPAGMHLVVDLAPALQRRMTDGEAARRLAANGVTAQALSSFFAGPPTRQGLVLGYAGFDEAALRAGVARIGEALSAKGARARLEPA